MEIIVISAAALLTSALTLFSGFGLGTLLLPVFAFFFPIEAAVTLTAIVHFLNNIFKLFLMGKYADWKVVFKFGLPAVIFAFIGAYLLTFLSDVPPIAEYFFLGEIRKIELIKIIISVLIFAFALFELLPSLNKLTFNKKYLGLGGVLSGFFGGLSGHQGALRSAFLIKLDLSKEAFIATGIVIASFIDATRLTVYSASFFDEKISNEITLLIGAILSAFIGAVIGKAILGKITLRTIQLIVGVLLIFVSVGLGMGLI